MAHECCYEYPEVQERQKKVSCPVVLHMNYDYSKHMDKS